MDFPRTLLKPTVSLARETMAHSELVLQRCRRGPMAVFMPAYGRTGAARLRIYRVAADLRVLGWRTTVLVPSLTLPQRRRFLAHARPDVVVMQGARHALNRPMLYPGAPIVYDMDDADFHLAHLAGPARAAMAEVAVVTAGSAYIADWARAAGAPAEIVWTGMPVSRAPRPPQLGRPPVVAWAQTRPMTYTREAAFVRAVMARVAQRIPMATLRLYDRRAGDDPAFLDTFRAMGIRTEWRPAMPLEAYLNSFEDVALGLAPLCPETPFSRGKSFGKILGYLDRHVPVIASDAGEHGAVFTRDSGVISSDVTIWAQNIITLLTGPEARHSMAMAGFSMFQSRLSNMAAARRMAEVLARQTGGAVYAGASRTG